MSIQNVLITILCILLAGDWFLVMRYNLHMFQLNAYIMEMHLEWLRKKHGKQRILVPLGLLGILAGVLPAGVGRNVVLVLGSIFALITMRYFWYLRSTNTKIRLVYTGRAKRLAGGDLLLSLLLTAVMLLPGGIQTLPVSASLAVSFQMFLLPLSDILNRPVQKKINGKYIRDARKKLSEAPDLRIIGVTGSYGKTSVKFYLKELLQERFNVLITPESYNTPMGVVKTIRENLRSTHEIFICEMGARCVGDIRGICAIAPPDMGVITSIGPQHLETFHSLENIIKTKFELADALPENGTLFLNGDNPYITENSKRYPHKVFYYTEEGLRRTENNENNMEGGGYCAFAMELSQSGTSFTVTSPSGEQERFHTRLVGKHNVINITGAIAAANTLGIPLKELKVPVRRIRPVPHRMEMAEKQGVTIIDDAYNSNPAGAKAAVETLGIFQGVRILITPGMVELGGREAEFNRDFGKEAAECCDYVILVGKKHTEPIREGLEAAGFPMECCFVYGGLSDAMACARGIRREGHKFILLENDLPDNY